LFHVDGFSYGEPELLFYPHPLFYFFPFPSQGKGIKGDRVLDFG
jgi:hypothetical protein